MCSNHIPSRLWDYGLVYISEIQSLLVRGLHQCPSIKRLTGDTIDISEWLNLEKNGYDR
jgi:hypothetical protein